MATHRTLAGALRVATALPPSASPLPLPQVGALESALEAFRDLQALGLAPNVVTYCGLISALGRERRRGLRFAATAAELWEELAGSGVQLDAAAYRAGEAAACLAGGTPLRSPGARNASPLFQWCPNAACSCAPLLAGPPEALPFSYGQRRCHGLLHEGQHATLAHNVSAPRPAGIKALVDVGRLKDADRLLQRMAAAGLPPDVRAHNALLAGHARAANTAAMARLMRRLVAARVAPSAVTFNTLLDGYVRARNLTAARAVLGQAAAAEVALDAWSYTTLIKGYVQVGAREGSHLLRSPLLARSPETGVPYSGATVQASSAAAGLNRLWRCCPRSLHLVLTPLGATVACRPASWRRQRLCLGTWQRQGCVPTTSASLPSLTATCGRGTWQRRSVCWTPCWPRGRRPPPSLSMRCCAVMQLMPRRQRQQLRLAPCRAALAAAAAAAQAARAQLE